MRRVPQVTHLVFDFPKALQDLAEFAKSLILVLDLLGTLVLLLDNIQDLDYVQLHQSAPC